MNIEATTLPEVMILTPRRFGDARGWFAETFNAARMREAGIDTDWVQDNHSFSAAKGTLRGLHYQRPPHAQAKLVRCSRGAILDVAVDFREGSPRFAQWVGVELSAGNGRQLLIPAGFLHGFVTLTPDVEVQYKCSDLYAPDCDGAVAWNDPEIGVDWGVEDPVLSDKDRAAPLLRDAPRPFAFGGAPCGGAA
ncbi:dTDP-4-dehydrorhamnose 3,5-epimerase [Pseudogemmobacter sonorensis]|uniref:dTDP-4-dehydrorhamnose 3,5-epimerase n=1 Tax=Pseudogemmobacter sonorensis TaxID=2989681 RepID=UPI0036B84BEF